ncbi:MAG: hypothetical protein MUF34_10810 [Polyangiaceae bacterium]|jgi:hypothetical protein|nr:hypothetical protein [Polyangiaceae bacterium]
MRFDELDRAMRVFETAHDPCAWPGLSLVARLDGQGFRPLTKEVHDFQSLLAGEASAKFSLGLGALGALGAFDRRLSQLPCGQDVVDSFCW